MWIEWELQCTQQGVWPILPDLFLHVTIFFSGFWTLNFLTARSCPLSHQCAAWLGCTRGPATLIAGCLENRIWLLSLICLRRGCNVSYRANSGRARPWFRQISNNAVDKHWQIVGLPWELWPIIESISCYGEKVISHSLSSTTFFLCQWNQSSQECPILLPNLSFSLVFILHSIFL